MKGQFRVINELLLFGIGALLALSVAGTISFAVTSLQEQTERDQYYMIANLVSMATTKTYICGEYGNCTLTVDIPQKLSDEKYIVCLSNNITISNFRTGEEIFIKAPKLNKTLDGTSTSSARYFVLDSTEEAITLSRW
jgi:hypothetical protein